MFEVRGSESRFAPDGGADRESSRPVTDAWGAGNEAGAQACGGARADAQTEAAEYLAAMTPGASLAGLIERLVAAGAEQAANGVSSGAGEDLAQGTGSGLARGETLGVVESLARLDPDSLRELVAACTRLSAWAGWAQSLMAAALSRCLSRGGEEVSGVGGVSAAALMSQDEARMSASSEITCRLGISRRRASDMIERGEALCQPDLSLAGGMFHAGLIDSAKFSLCGRRLDGVGSELCLQVQEQVLEQAAHRTHAQLARDLDKALAALDPEGVSRRRRRDTAGRHVTRPRPAGVGTSEMRMLLPTPDAYLLDAALEAVAASARAMGDGRTLSQLRADALVSMSLDLVRGRQHEAVRDRSEPGRSAAQGYESQLNSSHGDQVRASARDDQVHVPASDGSAYGGENRVPSVLDPARLLPDGVPVDALVASLSRLVSCTSPWWTPSGVGRVLFPSGLQIHVDVTVPADTLARFQELEASQDHPVHCAQPAGGTESPVSAEGTGTVRSAGSARLPGVAGNAEATGSPVGAVLSIGGYSTPVPAVVAAALAAGGTWRRLVTDPVSGAVLDVGRRRYRPPAALADAVRTRDASCTHPGCEVPARRCDIDHIRPWSQGGTTSLDNLTLLCQAHHYLKHSPGWSLTRTADGGLVWRTPTGARYRRDPDGRITMLAARVGPRQHQQDEHPVARALERAVTDEVLARLERGLSSSCGLALGWDDEASVSGWDGSSPTPGWHGGASVRGQGGSGPVAGRDDPALTRGQDGSSPAAGPDHRASAPDAPERGRPGYPGRPSYQGRPCLETRGPRPGQRAGDFEPHGYPPELHELGLAELLDAVVPF